MSQVVETHVLWKAGNRKNRSGAFTVFEGPFQSSYSGPGTYSAHVPISSDSHPEVLPDGTQVVFMFWSVTGAADGSSTEFGNSFDVQVGSTDVTLVAWFRLTGGGPGSQHGISIDAFDVNAGNFADDDFVNVIPDSSNLYLQGNDDGFVPTAAAETIQAFGSIHAIPFESWHVESGNPTTSGVNLAAQANSDGVAIAFYFAATCTFALSPPEVIVGAAASNNNIVKVSTRADCDWQGNTTDTAMIPSLFLVDANNNVSLSPRGPGSVIFSVSANPTIHSRIGFITIAGQQLKVTQLGIFRLPCIFALSPDQATIAPPGGGGTFKIQTRDTCPWTASISDSWIRITAANSDTGQATLTLSGASGTGPATIIFNVDPNLTPSVPRTGTIIIEGTVFTITQEACQYTVSPTNPEKFAPEGGNGGLTVNTNFPTCRWKPATTSQWIHIDPGFSGKGNGAVLFTVDENTDVIKVPIGPVFPHYRFGIIRVADQEVTVQQLTRTSQIGPLNP